MSINTLVSICVEISLKERLHCIITNKTFNIVEELETFFVTHFRESVIWINSTEIRVQGWKTVVSSESIDVINKVRISNLSFDHSKIFTIFHFTNFSFSKNCESFIKPHVWPVFAGHIISKPRVKNFMSSNIYLRFVSNNYGWGSKCHLWIFHTAIRETGRKNKNFIGFEGISNIEITLSILNYLRNIFKFFGNFIDLVRFSKHPILDFSVIS